MSLLFGQSPYLCGTGTEEAMLLEQLYSYRVWRLRNRRICVICAAEVLESADVAVTTAVAVADAAV